MLSAAKHLIPRYLCVTSVDYYHSLPLDDDLEARRLTLLGELGADIDAEIPPDIPPNIPERLDKTAYWDGFQLERGDLKGDQK